MADTELTVQQGQLYMLRWTTPDTQITNKFVNPDGSSKDFQDPDPPKEGAEEAVVKITARYGKDEASLADEGFLESRSRPFAARKVENTPKGKRRVKIFSATFEARRRGVYVFKVDGPEGKSETQTMTVVPAKQVYRTIQDVIDDIFAFRRQAIVANCFEYFPAYNRDSPPGHGAPGYSVGMESGHVGQGKYVYEYKFDGKGSGTSCTTVNPDVAKTFPGNPKRAAPLAENDSVMWSFNAGPKQEPGKSGNRAWLESDKDNIPSVGDTYIVLNNLSYYGHVGIILHVPPNGNGLWVTADGGQGGPKPTQLALLIPRWGLMGAMLPHNSGHRRLKPDDNGGPYLSGAYPADIDTDQPVPTDGDVAAIIKRIKFRTTPKLEGVSNPRKMEGYVNIDDPRLNFEVDKWSDDDPYAEAPAEIIDKCKKLQEKVAAVIQATKDGQIVGGQGT